MLLFFRIEISQFKPETRTLISTINRNGMRRETRNLKRLNLNCNKRNAYSNQILQKLKTKSFVIKKVLNKSKVWINNSPDLPRLEKMLSSRKK